MRRSHHLRAASFNIQQAGHVVVRENGSLTTFGAVTGLSASRTVEHSDMVVVFESQAGRAGRHRQD